MNREWVVVGRFTDEDACGPAIQGRYLELRGPGAIPFEHQTQYEFNGVWVARTLDEYHAYREARCRKVVGA